MGGRSEEGTALGTRHLTDHVPWLYHSPVASADLGLGRAGVKETRAGDLITGN